MEDKHAESLDDLLSVTPSAAIIGVHPQTLRNYELDGLITCHRTRGNERRFRRADLIAFRDNPPRLPQTAPVGAASPQAASTGVTTSASALAAAAGAATIDEAVTSSTSGAAPVEACSAPGALPNLVGADAHQ